METYAVTIRQRSFKCRSSHQTKFIAVFSYFVVNLFPATGEQFQTYPDLSGIYFQQGVYSLLPMMA